MKEYILDFLIMGLFFGSVVALVSNEVFAINLPNDNYFNEKEYVDHQIDFHHKLYCDDFKPIQINNMACWYNTPACWSFK